MLLTDAAGNQLRILRAKVQDDDRGGIHRSKSKAVSRGSLDRTRPEPCANEEKGDGPLLAEGHQPCRDIVGGAIVSAVHAVKVARAHAVETPATCCGNLKGALWTKVIIALHVRAARGARRD